MTEVSKVTKELDKVKADCCCSPYPALSDLEVSIRGRNAPSDMRTATAVGAGGT